MQEQAQQNDKLRKPSKPVHNVQDDTTDECQLLNITSPGKVTPWNITVDIEGVTVLLQLETGESLSLMSQGIVAKEKPFTFRSKTLFIYTLVTVSYKTRFHTVPLIIVKGYSLTLMGEESKDQRLKWSDSG